MPRFFRLLLFILHWAPGAYIFAGPAIADESAAVAPAPAGANRLRVELRWEGSPVFDDKIDRTAIGAHSIFPWLEVEGAVRMAHTRVNISALQYKGDLRLTLTSFLAITARVTHASYFVPGFSTTHLGAKSELHIPGIFGCWEPFLEVGWYYRFNRLQGSSPVPTFDGSFSENDYLLMVGNRFALSEKLEVALWAGTFETIDIFNLNNPYGQISLAYVAANDLTVSVFSRFRLLGGFGRIDSLLFGFGLTVPLERLSR